MRYDKKGNGKSTKKVNSGAIYIINDITIKNNATGFDNFDLEGLAFENCDFENLDLS